MIIDCHGHYTTAPTEHSAYRAEQLAALHAREIEDPAGALEDPAGALEDPAGSGPPGALPRPPSIGDDVLRRSVEGNQLRLMDERGIDLVLLSPQASAMGHHVPDRRVAVDWARACNELVGRVAGLYPHRFAPVCQLPQTPGGGLDDAVAELRRCVEEQGFVGANLNPDPSGGHWNSPPLTDPHWYPLYEALVELEVPAMIHVSGSCNPNFHALGAHYLNADTTAFMQFLEGDLFERFPRLRLVIPHGGGAVPYHWGRYQGLAVRLGRPPVEQQVMGNVSFDTCVYHQAGIDLLTTVVPSANLLFGSEMLGAVRGDNPETGSGWDDTRLYVDRAPLADDARAAVYEGNVRAAYPRLDARLRGQGR